MYGHGYRRRHRGCCHNDGDGVLAFVALLIMIGFALPIAGVYLLFAGKTEGQRVAGGIICVLLFFAWIGSMA